jgi:hypothetical protein
MRKLFGTGTPRQMAAAGKAFCALLRRLVAMAHELRTAIHQAERDFTQRFSESLGKLC